MIFQTRVNSAKYGPIENRFSVHKNSYSQLKMLPYNTLKKSFCACADEMALQSPPNVNLGVTQECRVFNQPASSYYIIPSISSTQTTLPRQPLNSVNGITSTHLRQPADRTNTGVFRKMSDKCIIHNVGIIDRYARRYFLLAYLLLNLFYWYYYNWVGNCFFSEYRAFV